MDIFFAAQLVGLVATVFSVAQMQIKSSRMIFLSGVPICSIWAVQYLMLGALSGFAANIVNVIRCLSVIFPARHRPTLFQIMNILVLSLTIATWAGPISLLVMVTGLIGNASLLVADNRKLVALSVLTAGALWLCYNIAVESWMGSLTNITVMASTLIGMARYEGWFQTRTAPIMQAAE